METTTLNISGMTCGHCVASVTEELEALDGVDTVSVDLNAGGVSTATVTANRTLTAAELGEAVAEAGYRMVGADA
ncbi:heavy-metal-associated domain-containing protein [Arthrobacter sp. zg-Y769]|uniref:heavy-metal-associated domain-containing protein n=1 Tax=Arthrobacter sp. zg-Y769 TaxID=2894191 RepID=UPI001E40CFD3|nr:heavy-metal-associated domain-containing protein [Arthrobacter sp. zg-Y769]MCC9205123.1 heavy-metal-associated domain-containing protein [Arthrobacter sp. zg-Y769]